jgi:hypothetical protein
MFVLHDDPYLSLRRHTDLKYVLLVRSDRQFGSVHRVATSLRECAKALGDIKVARLGLLLDWRLAPLTTDPVLLKHVVQQTDVFAKGFARRALLIATPVGVMQSERVARTIDHAKPVLFTDEAAAIAYVTKG